MFRNDRFFLGPDGGDMVELSPGCEDLEVVGCKLSDVASVAEAVALAAIEKDISRCLGRRRGHEKTYWFRWAAR